MSHDQSSRHDQTEVLKQELWRAAREGNAVRMRQLLGVEAGDEQATGAPPAGQSVTVYLPLLPGNGSSGSQTSKRENQNAPGSAGPELPEEGMGATDEDYNDDQAIVGFLRHISLLHVIASSGSGENYRECAKIICEKDKTYLLEHYNASETALDCAAAAGHTKMFLHLLHIVRSGGQGLSGEITMKEREIIGKTNGHWETELHRAVRQQLDASEFQRLKQEDGGLARVPDIHGMPPLYLAVSLGYGDVADNLISVFGDTLSYDGPDGQNVLHAAALRSKDLTQRILTKKVTLVNEADWSGSTPLHFVASVGVEGTTSLLLGRDKSGIWKKDNMGMYPIHIAASVGIMDAIYSLINTDQSCATLRDANGRTLLHIAVENGKCDVVKFICREPIPIFKDILNMKDNDGNTALHLAVRRRDQAMFSYLLGNRDVELNHFNLEGFTPLDLASRIKMENPFASPQNPTEWMIRALSHSGAHFSPRRRDKLLIHANSSGKKDAHGKMLAESTESVLIASALIATLTFTAAFTMPGSYKTDKPKEGTPALGNFYGFKIFLVADIFAFYFAVAATFSLAEYGNRGTVDPLVRCAYARLAVWLFHVALKSIIIAFALGVSVVMWDISLSTTVIVAIVTTIFMVYGNVSVGHDLRLMWLMYHRFGFSRSWSLYASTSAHLDWTSWRLRSFSATLLWNLV